MKTFRFCPHLKVVDSVWLYLRMMGSSRCGLPSFSSLQEFWRLVVCEVLYDYYYLHHHAERHVAPCICLQSMKLFIGIKWGGLPIPFALEWVQQRPEHLLRPLSNRSPFSAKWLKRVWICDTDSIQSIQSLMEKYETQSNNYHVSNYYRKNVLKRVSEVI